MPDFSKVPEKFATKTLYNPKLVLIQMDEIKIILNELQEAVINLTNKLESMEKMTSKKALSTKE